MEQQNKKLFKKLFFPLLQIVLLFAIVSFAINYFTIDVFVKQNAKEKISEAYNKVRNNSNDMEFSIDTSMYVYDNNYNNILSKASKQYVESDMSSFIVSLLENYELEPDTITNIRYKNKDYLAILYETEKDDDRKYFVIIQELTSKTEVMKDNFKIILLFQLFVLIVVVYLVIKIQLKNEEEMNRKNNTYENVAHDLRTPLVSILGYADGLKNGIIKDKDKACDVILKTGNQLKEMIENILILSRFDNDTFKRYDEDIDLYDLINEQVETVKFLDETKKIVVESKLPKEYTINTDKKLLIRIIQNLLSNAMKYANSKILVKLDNLDSKTIFSISDDGEGIDDKSIKQVFERYFKGSDGHFGIGLAVVKGAIEYLGGTINVERIKPNGTKFTITI